MATTLEDKPTRRWTTWKSSLWRVLRGVWAAEAELAAVFASALHGDPQLIELARRMLGEPRP